MVLHYQLVRTREQDFQNTWFAHARYNHEVSDFLRLEAFIQNQDNTQLTIVRRSLVGAGVRLKLINAENTKLYFGNSYMYEVETLKDTDELFYNQRNNSYLSINHSFKRINFDLIGTIYFQPLYNDIGNNRMLCQVKAELPLIKYLSLSALYNYSYIRFSSELQDDRSSNINLGLTLSI